MLCKTTFAISPKPKRLIFTPIEHTYSRVGENYNLVRMGKDEQKWVSIVGLVGLFELQWRVPHHEWLVEFLNTYQIKGETIDARMRKKTTTIDKCLIVNVFKISNKGWKSQKQIDKQITKAMLQCIALLGGYVNTKQWNVSMMKKPYDIHLPTFIQVIYQREKVYFSNKNAITIMKAMKGKEVDWVNTI